MGKTNKPFTGQPSELYRKLRNSKSPDGVQAAIESLNRNYPRLIPAIAKALGQEGLKAIGVKVVEAQTRSYRLQYDLANNHNPGSHAQQTPPTKLATSYEQPVSLLDNAKIIRGRSEAGIILDTSLSGIKLKGYAESPVEFSRAWNAAKPPARLDLARPALHLVSGGLSFTHHHPGSPFNLARITDKTNSIATDYHSKLQRDTAHRLGSVPETVHPQYTLTTNVPDLSTPQLVISRPLAYVHESGLSAIRREKPNETMTVNRCCHFIAQTAIALNPELAMLLVPEDALEDAEATNLYEISPETVAQSECDVFLADPDYAHAGRTDIILRQTVEFTS